MSEPTPTRRMSREEIEDWDELYQYVRGEIMGYDDTKALPRHFILRLRGLANGKFMANKSIKSYGSYDFKAILYAFKISKPDIIRALSQVVIKDEIHKVNLIMMIIEREINDVVNRMEKVKESNRRMKGIDLPHQDNERAEYKAEPKRRNTHLDNLW